MAPKVCRSVNKTPIVKAQKRFKYASDFSGLGTCGLSVKGLAKLMPGLFLPVHIFSCDTLRESDKFINFTDPPSKFFKDVLRRDLGPPATAPVLDLFSWTAPCQGLSQAGLQQGSQDPRTRLALASVAFIQKYQPKAFMMENVPTLATHMKFRFYWNFLRKELAKGYKIVFKMVNSASYVPQNRTRLYMIGVRNDLLRRDDNHNKVPWFPLPPSTRIPKFHLSNIIMPMPESKWQPHPAEKDAAGLYYRNVMNAYRKLSPGQNPFKVPVVIDFKSSERFASHRVDETPTLTRTRAGQFGYWCSTKGAPLDLVEMAMLQGFSPDDLPYEEAGITQNQVAMMLGNGQTLPVVMDILVHLLFHSGSLNYKNLRELKLNLYKEWRVPIQ
jgi:site-specific DNA-cytosine methylase